MSRAFRTILAATAALSLVAWAERPASAEEYEVTGPLAGAPPVRHLKLYRKGRFEIAPTASFTFLDEYRRTILFGARLQYNIADWIGIGVWGGYGAVSLTTDLTDQVDASVVRKNPVTASNVSPNKGGFADQTAKIQWVAVPQVQLVPFRGKLALFNSVFVDTDAYVHLGAGFVGLQERGDCGIGTSGSASCTSAASFALASRTAIAPTGGIGLNFYTGDLVAINIEYRALPFSWNRAGFDSRGSGSDGNFPDGKVDANDRTFKFNQMVTLGVGFSFPKPDISE